MPDETEPPGVRIAIRARATDQPTLDLLWRMACAYAQSGATGLVIVRHGAIYVAAHRTATGHVILRQMPD